MITEPIYEVESAKRLFKDSIESIFPKKLVSYAFLTGPFTFGSANHDIDIVVVLDDKLISEEEFKIYTEKVKRFSEKYLRIHKSLGYKPDLDFPSDVVTVAQIKDAIDGRGFDINNGKLDLYEITSKEGFLSPDIDYRVYLWELITSNNGFIIGNFSKFTIDSISALRSIILFTLTKRDNNEVSLRDIRDKIFRIAGLDERYSLISESLEPLIEHVLSDLVLENFLSRLGLTEEIQNFEINKVNLDIWEKSIISKHNERKWKGKSIFGSWDTLRDNAKRFLREWD